MSASNLTRDEVCAVRFHFPDLAVHLWFIICLPRVPQVPRVLILILLLGSTCLPAQPQCLLETLTCLVCSWCRPCSVQGQSWRIGFISHSPHQRDFVPSAADNPTPLYFLSPQYKGDCRKSPWCVLATVRQGSLKPQRCVLKYGTYQEELTRVGSLTERDPGDLDILGCILMLPWGASWVVLHIFLSSFGLPQARQVWTQIRT